MSVEEVAVDFMRWVSLGAGAVLGIIILIGLGMPRRKSVSVLQNLPEKHS